MNVSSVQEGRIPVWLDCDPGHDDAFAILFAAYHPELRLLGVSTVYGNAPLPKTTSNTLSILQAIGKDHIPVHAGSPKPFCRTLSTAPDIHGESGLDGTDLLPQPSKSAVKECNAIKEMRDALMTQPPQTAWLVATGALTNVALMFSVFPEVIDHIHGFSIMGGAIGNNFAPVYMGPVFTDDAGREQARIGNWSPYAEFNIWCDPEAAKNIFQNASLSAKTVLIPLDVTHQAFATKGVRDFLLHAKDNHKTPTRLRTMFHELLMFFASTYAEVFGLDQGPPLHDPLAVYMVLAQSRGKDLFSYDDRGGERWIVDIVLEGKQTGRTVVKPAADGVLIPRTLDTQNFWQLIEECLARADRVMDHAR